MTFSTPRVCRRNSVSLKLLRLCKHNTSACKTNDDDNIRHPPQRRRQDTPSLLLGVQERFHHAHHERKGENTGPLSIWLNVMSNILNYGVSTNLGAAAMAAEVLCCQILSHLITQALSTE